MASSERDIWAPDEDPWTARAEGALYALGASYLYRVAEEVHLRLGLPFPQGAYLEALRLRPQAVAKGRGLSREEAMARAEELYERVLAGHERLPPARYRELAEAVTEKWYAEGRLETRAQRRSVAAYLLGMLRGGKRVGLGWRGLLGERERERLAYVAARGAEFIRKLKEATRQAVAKVLLLWHEEGGGQPKDLEGKLQEAFGGLARDWRRVAITEVAHARSSGYLAALPEGATVEWSAAKDACPRCRALHGRRFRVRHAPGDPREEVWPGKGWERGPTIPLHPHCRCRWIAVTQPVGEVDPEIEALAQAVIRAAER
ncbi:hypothetical protein [Thermus sp. 93170]|uniref:hypothetical protein n=1 Tax=Thermus sp. 93170 TaxID=1046939 RepID=UPI003F425EED